MYVYTFRKVPFSGQRPVRGWSPPQGLVRGEESEEGRGLSLPRSANSRSGRATEHCKNAVEVHLRATEHCKNAVKVHLQTC